MKPIITVKFHPQGICTEPRTCHLDLSEVAVIFPHSREIMFKASNWLITITEEDFPKVEREFLRQSQFTSVRPQTKLEFGQSE